MWYIVFQQAVNQIHFNITNEWKKSLFKKFSGNSQSLLQKIREGEMMLE